MIWLYLALFFAAFDLLCMLAGALTGYGLWLVVRAVRRRRAFRLTTKEPT